jgi:hypothetical protein
MMALLNAAAFAHEFLIGYWYGYEGVNRASTQHGYRSETSHTEYE